VANVATGEPEVGQRLKRMATILDKLEREPTMALSRMHDIAGCRAVVRKQATVDMLIDRLRAESPWELLPKTWDYVAEPKPDG
jgi:putative GTP pyrophosphokinase